MVKQSKKKLTGGNVVLINLISLALLEKARTDKFTKQEIKIQVSIENMIHTGELTLNRFFSLS